MSLHVQQTPNPSAHDPELDPPLSLHSALKYINIIYVIDVNPWVGVFKVVKALS